MPTKEKMDTLIYLWF